MFSWSCREALGNLASRMWMSIVITATVAVVSVGATLWSAHSLLEIRQTEQVELFHGSHTYRAITSDNRALPAERCDELGQLDGVLAAGGTVAVEFLSARQHSGSVMVHRVTPGYHHVAFPELTRREVVGARAGSDVALAFGIQPGSILEVTRAGVVEGIRVDVVETQPSRFEGLGRAVLETTSGEPVKECLASALPEKSEALMEAMTAWFPGQPTIVSKVAPAGLVSSEALYKSRVSQFVGVGTGILLTLACVVYLLTRAKELVLYRSLHAQLWVIMVMVTVEVSFLVIAPASAGMAIGLGIRSLRGYISAWELRTLAWEVLWACLIPLSCMPAVLLLLRPGYMRRTLRSG